MMDNRNKISMALSVIAVVIAAASLFLPRPDKGAEEPFDVQYVMYVGTNDKDTNEPVYPPEEAKKQVEDVLVSHFGGYTVQDADGGWIDDGTVYQEYSIVVYLSDTTENEVHAAADELIDLLNQSSVLIQSNRTKTEFYSGAE